MKPLNLDDLKHGQFVWLESYGCAFKTLKLSRSFVIAVTCSAVYFAFPFLKLNCETYNSNLTWRCWDQRPDMDTLAEEEWTAIAI